MIVRARVVVTMDGTPIENGAVAISGKQILDVGNFREISARNSGKEIVDLGDRALLPGLINAHCHLDYTCLRGKIPQSKSFADWIRAINAAKAKLSEQEYVASINEGFAEAKRFGTTTIANLTAFPELVSRVSTPIRTWWFGELIDVRGIADVDLAVDSLQRTKHWGLAPHAPFTASASLYRRCEEMAPLLTTHVAESREEMLMFRNATGPLYEFLKEIGRDMSDCGDKTPIEHLLTTRDSFRLRAATARQATSLGMTKEWIVAHLNELAESDFDLLQRSTPKFSIVHCPRSHDYFGHSPFKFERLRALGFNVCLGTDSLASNEDLSLFAEMRAFQNDFPDVAPEEILQMATTNAARALRQENSVGRIQAGFVADLIAVPCQRSTRLRRVFEEIIASDQPVGWTMISGNILD
jgi:cytosine/adenosine deaminase-related metal-dependent hydrolase